MRNAEFKQPETPRARTASVGSAFERFFFVLRMSWVWAGSTIPQALGPIRDSAAVTSIWRAIPPESFSLSRSPGSTQNRLILCLVARERATIPDLLSRFHREERSGG